MVWKTLVAALQGVGALADPAVVTRLYPEVGVDRMCEKCGDVIAFCCF